MQTITAGMIALSLSATTILSAQSTATDNVESTPTVNTGKGFYAGIGMGSSFYNVALSQGTYYIKDDSEESVQYTISGDNLEELDDIDLGYVVYAGYLFNKIIGVEGSFTDYGSFTGTIEEETATGRTKKKTFSKKPKAMAVYANAGYTFFNGQLRPFGNLGLGYMKTYQSQTYADFQFQEDFLTLHYGLGVDYYPTALKGFGVRASYVGDSFADYNVDSYEGIRGNTTVKSTTLWQTYSLIYVSAQYKF